MGHITDIKIITSLEKIYDEDKIPQNDIRYISLLKNEKKSFQVAIESDSDSECNVSVNSTFKSIKLYTVKHIKSDLPMSKNGADDYYRFSKSGYYPDLLVPLGDKVDFSKGITVLWAEIDGKDGQIGVNEIEITVGDKTALINAEIIDAELDFKDFVYTCWFHTDCLMSYYGFDAFSDEYWRVTENFLKTAREYGMNCVLTPLFTPPLDTEKSKERPTVQLVDVTLRGGEYSFNFDKLTRWIDMSHRCGVEYFELSHLYTQWGARHAPKIMAQTDEGYKRIFGWETRANSKKYKAFLKAFSTELKKYIEEKGLREKVFIHVSDEPNFSMLIPYSKASKYIHSLFNGYKIIDALSDVRFYKLKIVTNPIPANDSVHNFIGKTENLWTYYCSSQKNHCVSNRFFCNSSLRTRVLGYQMYKYNIKGFLHWGYNFYYTRFSKALVDPFKISDAGGQFPSGDSYVVYPAPDGTPYQSIRLKVFYDALQDTAALNTLEKLTDKKTCMDIIEENGKYNLTFKEYPHSDEWLLNTREKVNERIKVNLNS